MGDDVWPRWGSLATHRRKEIEDKDTQVNDSPGLIYLTSENLNPPLEEDYYDDHGEEEDTDPVSAKVPVADWEPRVVCPQFQLQDDYSRASNTRLKLRALDFLSYIPMETEVVEPHANDETLSAAVGSEAVGHKTEEAAGGDESRDVTPPNFVASENATTAKPRVDDPLVGIRLRGNSNVEHVSMKCQHRSPTKYGHSNRRLVRSLRNQQEQQLINNGIHDSSRIFLSWEKAYPAMAFSVVKYDESSESKRKKKLRLSSVIMEMPRRRNEVPKILSDATWLKKRWGTSYARYFDPRWADASGDKVDPVKAAKEESWDRNYRANALDDTRIRQGKHRTVQSLDGYYFSFLPYTKKKDLKSELNELFREQHPDLPHDLTLSKIRNLKKEVLEHVRNVGLEMTTAALAIIYFEKLVFKGVVSKQNRKLVMSVCLVLAYKFNEKKNFQGSETLKKLLEDIERIQSLSPKQVLEAEFPVFGHLLFHLKVDTDEVMVHFSRLLKMTELNPITYLGEDLAKFFFPDDEEKTKLGDLTNLASPFNTQKHASVVAPSGSTHAQSKKKKKIETVAKEWHLVIRSYALGESKIVTDDMTDQIQARCRCGRTFIRGDFTDSNREGVMAALKSDDGHTVLHEIECTGVEIDPDQLLFAAVNNGAEEVVKSLMKARNARCTPGGVKIAIEEACRLADRRILDLLVQWRRWRSSVEFFTSDNMSRMATRLQEMERRRRKCSALCYVTSILLSNCVPRLSTDLLVRIVALTNGEGLNLPFDYYDCFQINAEEYVLEHLSNPVYRRRIASTRRQLASPYTADKKRIRLSEPEDQGTIR